MTFRKLSLLLFGIASWHANGAGEVTLSGHYQECRGIGFKPDGKQIVLAVEDNPKNLRPDPPSIHNTATGETLWTLPGHVGPVWDAVFDSIDGSRIATASADSTIKMWEWDENGRDEDDGPNWVAKHDLAGHEKHVMTIDWHPKSNDVFVAGDSKGNLRIWKFQRNALITNTYLTWTSEVTAMPDPSTYGDEFSVYDKVFRVLTSIRYSPSGNMIAVCGFHMMCNVLSAPSVIGQQFTVGWLEGPNGPTHAGAVWSVAFSDSEKLIVTGGNDHVANVFENTQAANGGIKFEFKATLSIVSYDQSWTRSCDVGHIPVGDGGACEAPYYIHGPVFAVNFHGEYPVTGNTDHRIRVWNGDPSSGYSPGFIFEGCMSQIWKIVLNKVPNQQALIAAACGSDSTGRVWKVPGSMSFTSTTTTAPFALYQGAGERVTPGFLAFLVLLVSGVAQRGA